MLINILTANNVTLNPPYNYSFLINLIKDFFELTYIITLVGISATVRLTECLIVTNPLLIRLVSLMLAVKSRYNIFSRQTLDKILNPAVFNTGLSEI